MGQKRAATFNGEAGIPPIGLGYDEFLHMPEPVGTGVIGLLMLTAAHFIRNRATGA